MKTTIPISVSLLTAFLALSHSVPGRAAAPITVDTKNLLLQVDADNARWSAQVKGTPMQLNDVHFLPGDDASGWTITSAVNNNDASLYGSFVTVTLRGTKPGNWISSIRSPPAKPTATFWSAWAAQTTRARRWTSGTWITLCRMMRGWAARWTNGSRWGPVRAIATIMTYGR